MDNLTAKKTPGAPSIFNMELITSAIIPLIIFHVFNYRGMTLAGTIVSGCWCIGLLIIKYARERKINVIALLSGGFSIIGLLCTVIAQNPTFYLIEPIFEDALYAGIFFGSLMLARPLIQILVEDSHVVAFPENFRTTPEYKSAWRILTIAWGILNVSQGLLRLVLLYSVPIELYYTVSKLYVHISSPLLMLASYKFPSWYWRRSGVIK